MQLLLVWQLLETLIWVILTKKLGSAALKAVKLDLKALKAVIISYIGLKSGFCCLKSLDLGLNGSLVLP